MRISWKLRMTAAHHGVWTGTDLRRLLRERAGLDLSSASVSALFTKQPTQIKLTTLIALCTALGCTPNDLFDVDTTPVEVSLPHPALPARATVPAVAGRGRSLPPM
jgi:DNA-binding Xre family transcriptional regulator